MKDAKGVTQDDNVTCVDDLQSDWRSHPSGLGAFVKLYHLLVPLVRKESVRLSQPMQEFNYQDKMK